VDCIVTKIILGKGFLFVVVVADGNGGRCRTVQALPEVQGLRPTLAILDFIVGANFVTIDFLVILLENSSSNR